MIEFSSADLEQLSKKGIFKEKVLKQIKMFVEGIPFVVLEKAAVVSDGIVKLTADEEKECISNFEKGKDGKKLLKFVPASGAASRMFKSLFSFLENFDPDKDSLSAYVDKPENKEIKAFVGGMEKLPFYTEVVSRITEKPNSDGHRCHRFVQELLLPLGFNYGTFPKGLLPFHKYKDHVATPFEEHLYEGAAYATEANESSLHFTISEHHEKLFLQHYKDVEGHISAATDTRFNVDFSFQKAATDTIAVDKDNLPFRNNDGSLLFRPGGHGALIENLAEQDADIIFIKNIDNVVSSKHAEEIAKSKKILAGYLLGIQEKAFSFAKMLEAGEVSATGMEEIISFLKNKLNVRFASSFKGFSVSQQLEVLKDKINRPIRVCGMVKNEGEPGGGPFWILDKNGHTSLQIVESAQIDKSNEKQLHIMQGATHFNPVDIVCGVRNYKNKKFNLINYVDTSQGFITEKTKEGKVLKALELPGLWNGAMAFWNTVFVEVPLNTFNPVKTVNDLLKPAHQTT